MKNVIIDPGIIPINNVKEATKNSIYKVNFIQQAQRKDMILKEWPSASNYAFYTYDELKTVLTLRHPEYVMEHYTEVFNKVISDFRTLLIGERVNQRFFPWQNCFDDIIIVSNLVVNYLDLFCDINPIFVFYEATPHNIGSYTLGKIAEIFGIPVYMLDLRLPWKSYIMKGIDTHTDLVNDFSKKEESDFEYIKSYFDKNTKKYDEAITPYEREFFKERKGNLWSWKAELKDCFKNRFHRRVVALFRKYVLYKYYYSLVVKDLPPKDYIVVFLHYQPERTTLPEAQFFVQQLHMIRTIQLALPGYKILVKEHPGTFAEQFNIKYRSKRFYHSLSQMKDVSLIDPRIDSFSLVDNSLCVVTVRGTVGLQSLIRGKQVLCFGLSSYTDFDGCYFVHSCKDVIDAISDIKTKNQDSNYNLSQKTLEKLKQLDKSTISGIRDRSKIGELLYNLDYKLEADGILLEKILRGETNM